MNIDLGKLHKNKHERRTQCCYRRVTNCRKEKCSCVCESCQKQRGKS